MIFGNICQIWHHLATLSHYSKSNIVRALICFTPPVPNMIVTSQARSTIIALSVMLHVPCECAVAWRFTICTPSASSRYFHLYSVNVTWNLYITRLNDCCYQTEFLVKWMGMSGRHVAMFGVQNTCLGSKIFASYVHKIFWAQQRLGELYPNASRWLPACWAVSCEHAGLLNNAGD